MTLPEETDETIEIVDAFSCQSGLAREDAANMVSFRFLLPNYWPNVGKTNKICLLKGESERETIQLNVTYTYYMMKISYFRNLNKSEVKRLSNEDQKMEMQCESEFCSQKEKKNNLVEFNVYCIMKMSYFE